MFDDFDGQEPLNKMSAVIIAAIASFVLATFITSCETNAHADTNTSTTAAAIQKLQPAADPARADRLGRLFDLAAKTYNFDPRVLVALSFRESSLSIAVETLVKRGQRRNELGLMQVHGAALNFRPDNCPRTMEGARCQIMTGTNYLAHVRKACPGPRVRWLAAYATGKCYSIRNNQDLRQLEKMNNIVAFRSLFAQIENL